MQYATRTTFNLQCVQFVTHAICKACKLEHVPCNLQHVQLKTYAICNTCNLQRKQFATHAICNTCTLQHVQLKTMCNVHNVHGKRAVLWFIGRGLTFLSRGHRGHWRLYPLVMAFIVCFLQLIDFCIWEIYFVILIYLSIYVCDIS